MYSVILENEQGLQLEFSQGGPFTITEIQGLSPASATINISDVALIDGGKYNSSKVNVRSLNVAFAIEYEAPKNRIEVYKVLKSKNPIRLYYKGSLRDVYIDGYIESIDIDHFAMKQTVVCSILCPYPYFKEAQYLINEIKTTMPYFHFPFAITKSEPIPVGYLEQMGQVVIANNGDINCGMVVEMYARNEVVNPKLFNYETADFIGLNITMGSGDLITIDTRKGHKTLDLLRDGEHLNIFNALAKGSKWIELICGETLLVYECESGGNDLIVTIYHNDEFEGV